MCPNLDGMAWGRSWTYNGGHGLAGLHAEDGLLHFGHLLLDVQLSFPYEGCIDATGSLPLDEQLVSVMQMLSSKVWVVSTKYTSPEHVIALNELLGKLASTGSLVDELLVSREYVLDPRVFEDAPNWQVITQTSGEMVYGDAAHSVLGSGFFSMACNFAMKTSFSAYIMAEQKLGAFVRMKKINAAYHQVRRQMNGERPTPVRNFVFTSALITYFLTTCLKFDTYPSFIMTSLRKLYKGDKNKHKQLAFPILINDKYFLPVNSADRQCEKCGVGYVIGLYALDGKGVCVDCVIDEKKRKKYSFVSLFNGFLAKMTGILE